MEMPIMQPVPIHTKDVKWWRRLWRWVTCVRRWVVAQDYTVTLWGITYFIPKGFVFDGASVPKLFWSVLSPVGLLLIQGIIHDYAYKFGYVWIVDMIQGAIVDKRKFGVGKPRNFWDRLFKEVGREVNGVNIVNWIAWAAVRVGGWLAWNGHRKRDPPTGSELE